MVLHSLRLILAIGFFGTALSADGNFRASPQNVIPKYPYDPETSMYCRWWLDNDGSWTCGRIEAELELSLIDFKQWNPSVTLPCDVLPANQSFCVAASGPPWPTQLGGASTTKAISNFNNTALTITNSVTETVTRDVTVQVAVPTTVILTERVSVTAAVTVPVTQDNTLTVTKSIVITTSVQAPASTEFVTKPTTILSTITTTVSVNSLITNRVTVDRPVTTRVVLIRTVTQTIFVVQETVIVTSTSVVRYGAWGQQCHCASATAR